jgi:hypothetical protein
MRSSYVGTTQDGPQILQARTYEKDVSLDAVTRFIATAALMTLRPSITQHYTYL